MPITLEEVGAVVTIKRISGNDEAKSHLADLGFVVGTTVTIINKLGNSVILQVHESRVALSESMARRIII